MQRRHSVPWDEYLDEIVVGLRRGETATGLCHRINHRFNVTLRDTNFYGAMREKGDHVHSDGPLVRLLRDRYPDEAAGFLSQFRNKGKRDAAKKLPRWKRRLTPEQAAALEELKAEPATAMRYRCCWLVGEERCGKLTLEPFCLRHRSAGRKWQVEELVHHAQRAA